jgi:DNA polymerase-3 subunit beta
MTHAVGVVDRKQTVPIFGYALFNASKEDGTLTITSTNLDITIIDKIKCEVEKSGSRCLPATLLYDITKKTKNESVITIAINEFENSVSVSSGKATFNIHYADANDFPPVAEAEYTVKFQLNSSVFQKAIDTAKVAMLQDNTRFHLNGIHMHYENDMGINKLKFVATDLFRISCVSIVAPSESQNMPSIIVSKKAVAEILKLVDDSSSDTVDLSVSNSRISCKLRDDCVETEFSSRLVNGTFPEYKSALDVSNDKILQINTEEFIAAIDRVSTVVVDSTSSIKLNIHSDKLILSGISKELGSAVEEIEATFNAFEPMEICFNSRYLIEILNRIETDAVKMMLAESDSSTIIVPTEALDQEQQFAIMPIEIVKN